MDETCEETTILILTKKVTDEVNEILKKLSEEQTNMIAGFQKETVEVLDPDSLVQICAFNSKVIAQTSHGDDPLRLRLYELEQRLDKHTFARISNSEIINLKKVKRFDLSISGTICVMLSGHFGLPHGYCPRSCHHNHDFRLRRGWFLLPGDA